LIIINNITKTLSEWCEIYNMDYNKVYMRIKRGWSPKKALEIK